MHDITNKVSFPKAHAWFPRSAVRKHFFQNQNAATVVVLWHIPLNGAHVAYTLASVHIPNAYPSRKRSSALPLEKVHAYHCSPAQSPSPIQKQRQGKLVSVILSGQIEEAHMSRVAWPNPVKL